MFLMVGLNYRVHSCFKQKKKREWPGTKVLWSECVVAYQCLNVD